jgi:dethiobiotin synthetase
VRGCLVTGTDTGAGKTVLAAAIVAGLAAAGEPVRAHKPVVTGVDEPNGDWPADHELLGAMAGMDPGEVSPVCFGPPVSPHLAAEMAGQPLDPRRILGAARAAAGTGDGPLVVEGVGGLLVPLAPGYLIADLAAELGLPVVIAARPGLGTINHSLLTVAAARSRGLDVRAVVLTPWPRRPGAIERSNRDTIGRLGEVEVHVLPEVAAPRRELLAAAAAPLPLREWIEGKPVLLHASDRARR